MSTNQKQIREELESIELSNSILSSAHNAVKTCLSSTSKDNAVVIFDDSTKLVAAALLNAFLQKNTTVLLFNLDFVSTRPLTRFPAEIFNALKNATCSAYAVKSLRGELSARKALLEKLEILKIRHAHMPSITPQVFEDGLAMDYKKVSHFIKGLVSILKKANLIKITTPAGTNLEFPFLSTPSYHALDGLIKTEKWQNLPSGQLLIYPTTANGQFVADCSIGDWFEHKYNISEYPITFDIENGYVRSIECENQKLERDLKLFLRSSENSGRVSQLIIGANLGLTQKHSLSIFNGYKPGASIAFGSPQAVPGFNWTSATFLPAISNLNSIFLNDRKIMNNNEFSQDLLTQIND